MRRVVVLLLALPLLAGCATVAAPASPDRCTAFAAGVRELSLRIQTGMERWQYMERVGDLFVMSHGADCEGPEAEAFSEYMVAAVIMQGPPDPILTEHWASARTILLSSPQP